MPYQSVASEKPLSATTADELGLFDENYPHTVPMQNLDKYEAAVLTQPGAGRGKIEHVSQPLDKIVHAQQQLNPGHDVGEDGVDDAVLATARTKRRTKSPHTVLPVKSKRKPVNQRWCYEPISSPALVTHQSESSLTSVNGQPHVSFEKEAVSHDTFQFNYQDPAAKLVDLPADIGAVDEMTDEFLATITNDELEARQLQGTLFYDSELEWCRINGWGVESGIPILFYSPLGSQELLQDEEYASLINILAWIRQSEVPAVTPMFKPSRILRPSMSKSKALCYKQKSFVAKQGTLPVIGQYNDHVGGPQVGSYNGKILTNKTIKRILRAQETIFKYGTLIPRNDAEANRSPEAVRWMSGNQRCAACLLP